MQWAAEPHRIDRPTVMLPRVHTSGCQQKRADGRCPRAQFERVDHAHCCGCACARRRTALSVRPRVAHGKAVYEELDDQGFSRCAYCPGILQSTGAAALALAARIVNLPAYLFEPTCF